MNLLSVEKLSKSYGERVLFSELSFGISQGEKVALIAPNGSGKSSLLSIIAGKDVPDSGEVVFRKDISVGFLCQDADISSNASVGEYLFDEAIREMKLVRTYEETVDRVNRDPNDLQAQQLLISLTGEMDKADAWNIESRARQVLGTLGIHQLEQTAATLSGGQKKRLQLAKLLIAQPDFLILDEPTNHLDREVTEWLENWLDTAGTTLLMVTHDRYFLDRICNRIIELDNGTLYNYLGNFEYFLEKKTEREQAGQAALEKNLNLYRRELEWVRKMPKARGTKSKSRLQAFDDLSEKTRRKKTEDPIQLNIKMSRVGGKVLELKKVYKSFGDHTLLKGFDYTFKTGERIGIVGKNGTGKSTFLNVILGLEPADSGKINPGETIVFGYYTQQGLKDYGDKRVIDVVKDLADVIETADGTKISAAQFLQRFRFGNDKQHTPVSKLSGGEKRRLHLLTVLIKNPNFLILDEPTNDLDLLTMVTLEEFLMHFSGCLLVVSHDRYFLDKVTDHLFVFEGEGNIKDFPGTYDEYKKWKEKQATPVATTATQQEPVAKDAASDSRKKLSFKEKFELESLNKEMASLEEEKQQLGALLSSGESNHNKLFEWSSRLQEIDALLDSKTLRWFELSEKSE